MTIQTFNDIFVESSNIVRGTFDSFREKLSLLVRLTEKGSFGFSLAELQKYLTDYENRGYPVVSHSREYRDSYRPAYRVVRESIFEKAYGLRKTT
jgi:glutathione peroxidase-family protein